MKRAPSFESRQRGFALVAAIFFLVVVAALGTFAVRLNVNQQHSTDLDLAVARAEAAAQSGIQYAAARLLTTSNCAGVNGVNGESPPLSGGSRVDLTCAPQNPLPVVNGVPVNVFLVTATATRGNYGSPEFVSRQRIVRITP